MATILDLLMALNRDELPAVPAPARPVPMAPAPTGNVPEYGGPSQVTEPPQAPLDTRLIQQMLALRGPAPTAPAPLSRGQRIANALLGFSQGLEGRGGQFLQQLQEPQREYQRQLSAYNNLGTELGARGLETAQRRQEQQTRRAQEVSDREFEAEVKRETRRLNLTDQREIEMFRDTLLAKRQREDDERQAKLEEQKQRAAKEKQRNDIVTKLQLDNFAPPKFAQEIADSIVFNKPLSVAAEKWRSLKAQRLEAQLAKLNGAGGGGQAGGKLMAQLEGGQIIPASLVDKSKGYVVLNGKPVKVVGYTGGGSSTPPQQSTPQMPGSPYMSPLAESGMLSGGGGKTITKDAVNRAAAKAKVSPAVAAQQFRDAGYTIQ